MTNTKNAKNDDVRIVRRTLCKGEPKYFCKHVYSKMSEQIDIGKLVGGGAVNEKQKNKQI